MSNSFMDYTLFFKNFYLIFRHVFLSILVFLITNSKYLLIFFIKKESLIIPQPVIATNLIKTNYFF